MVIRAQQLDGMDEALQKEYYADLHSLLRGQFPQLTDRFDDSTLLERIKGAIPRARAYGIHTNEAMLAYVGLSIAAGPAFHDNPQIRGFLDQKSDDPDVKVNWMFNRVVQSLQQIVKTSISGRGPLELRNLSR